MWIPPTDLLTEVIAEALNKWSEANLGTSPLQLERSPELTNAIASSAGRQVMLGSVTELINTLTYERIASGATEPWTADDAANMMQQLAELIVMPSYLPFLARVNDIVAAQELLLNAGYIPKLNSRCPQCFRVVTVATELIEGSLQQSASCPYCSHVFTGTIANIPTPAQAAQASRL